MTRDLPRAYSEVWEGGRGARRKVPWALYAAFTVGAVLGLAIGFGLACLAVG